MGRLLARLARLDPRRWVVYEHRLPAGLARLVSRHFTRRAADRAAETGRPSYGRSVDHHCYYVGRR